MQDGLTIAEAEAAGVALAGMLPEARVETGTAETGEL